MTPNPQKPTFSDPLASLKEMEDQLYQMSARASDLLNQVEDIQIPSDEVRLLWNRLVELDVALWHALGATKQRKTNELTRQLKSRERF